MLFPKTFYTFAHTKIVLGFEALFFIFFKLKRAVVPSNCSCFYKPTYQTSQTLSYSTYTPALWLS